MIFGHLGVASLVRATQRDPRGAGTFIVLCCAAVLPDIMDVAYALIGVCSPYGLYSHTIPAIALETAVVGGVALVLTGSRGLAAALAMVVPLHLAADFFTMNKLLMPGGELAGLNFFRRPLVDFMLEVPLVVVGWLMLRRSGRGPGWSVTLPALATVLLLQTVFDVDAHLHQRVIKPNACLGAPSPLSAL